MFITSKKLFQSAYSKFGIGAYSINTIEQIVAVFRGGLAAQAPLILQISGKAHEYVGPGVLESAIHATAKNFPGVVYGVHLDHGDEQTAHWCVDSGLFSSVMVDASRYSFEENIAITRRVVQHARVKGITTEAELGRLGGKEDDIDVTDSESFLTDPSEALDFVQQTEVDSLAVSVGTNHGIKKFRGTHHLDFDRLEKIKEKLPGFPLVLHGASSIPAVEINRINSAGGAVDTSSHGVPEDEYLSAAHCGIAKFNIDSDSRLVWTRVHREFYIQCPQSIDFREPGKIYMDEFAKTVVQHSILFGCAGKSSLFLESKGGVTS